MTLLAAVGLTFDIVAVLVAALVWPEKRTMNHRYEVTITLNVAPAVLKRIDHLLTLIPGVDRARLAALSDELAAEESALKAAVAAHPLPT